LMLEVVKAEIPDVCSLNSEVDPELSRILAKMVAKDPADRYQSCQELCDDLARYPLVAKGGPVALQTRLSPAAATMVGQKTPLSGQRPLSATTPVPQAALTPTPVTNPNPPTPAPVSNASTATPVPAQPVAESAGTGKRSPVLPLAIAAILLLGIAGGAFAFRDRIPFLQHLLGPGNQAVQIATTTTPPAPTQAAAPSPATPGPAASTAPAAANTGAAAAQTAQTGAPPATTPPPSPTQQATSNSAADTANNAPAGNAESGAGPAARASQVEPLKQLAAAEAARAPAQQLAKAERPTPVKAPPKPHVPTIAILAVGDLALSAPAQQAIENRLSRHGFHVEDQDTIPGLDRYLRRKRPLFAEILRALSRRGRVDAVVFVHARAVGSQELTYYGQSSTLYTAQLGVRAYAVGARRLLGRGWTKQVNFTSLNATQKANEAVGPMLDQVEDQLSDYRPRRHRG